MQPGLAGQGDQISAEGWPGRFAGDAWNDLVGSVVERLDQLRSDDVFGGDVQTVVVPLDPLMEPDRGVADFSVAAWWLRWVLRRGPGPVRGGPAKGLAARPVIVVWASPHGSPRWPAGRSNASTGVGGRPCSR
jgi:hypothetical protein